MSPFQQMWAPWRMDFLRAPKEKGCFMCRIAGEPARDAENYVVKRDGTCLLLLNRYPYNGGHLLVAPLRHVASLGELEEAELLGMMRSAQLGERLLRRVAKPDAFNFGINQGAAAGAGLKDHLHLHVVPRWNGDMNFLPVFSGVRVVPQALDELHAALVAALAEEEAGA